MPGSTRLHLVRHAHTDAVGVLLAGRAPGFALNEQGRREAGILGTALAYIQTAAIFTSPQQRTQQTANCIAAGLNLALQTEPALDEIDFGEWTGKHFEALNGQPAWHQWNTHRSIAQCPAGETMLAVQHRATAFAHALATDRRAQDVILVSHGDVLKALLCCALGMSLDDLHRFEISPASHSIVSISDAGWKVELLNRTYAG